jgi:hypothetical protein
MKSRCLIAFVSHIGKLSRSRFRTLGSHCHCPQGNWGLFVFFLMMCPLGLQAAPQSLALQSLNLQARSSGASRNVGLAKTTSLIAMNSEETARNTPPSSYASLQINPPVAKKSAGLLEAGWTLGLGGESFANDREQAQSAGFDLGGALRYGLLKSVEVKAKANISLYSGYVQSRFGDQTPRSGVFLQEAVVQIQPISQLTLLAGAIDQGHLRAPLLVSARPFPGALQRLVLSSERLELQVKAQQTIPTSTTLATRSVDIESSPTFFTETCVLTARPFQNLTLTAHATHFAFRDLPSAVAGESSVHGNTVDDVTPNKSRFVYNFDGWLAGGGGTLAFSDNVSLIAEGYMIQNSQAPESYRNGQTAALSLELTLPNGIELVPKAEVYFNESDVSPAYYNSSAHGHGNRVGWVADFEVRFKKRAFEEAFKVGARLIEADLINPDLNQSRQRHFMIRFETMYDAS